MLVINNVTKKYGKFVANDNISFQVGDGEIAVLLGPNGAGKSTIIKCICGLLRFQGNISIEGFDNKSVEAKRIIGYIPEVPVLYDMLTVEEHLEFIARGYNLTDWREYAEKLLRIFELDDKKQKFGKELSKGMQQKVSICCALLPKPKVIIFDEPLVGLDPHGIKALKELIMELKNQGAAMIISTHMIDSVKEFWDVAHIMMNGKIAATRVKEDAEKSNEGLEELFFHITEGKGDQ
ncbi:ABC transporter ATP-binding protein [Clostridium sulfidigenes]|uniref:ABC transporter ATP-binding protein n=1 Tax=Clostridium sulfidigenes TaxID=318464 RepID=A0A084JHG8_9CLOT|nr:ABC transporter ATP-binding protein [Clostridium sulfidigenes]KEZ88402.1 ABC transporter ATP-binding protein [Clostridium sulfidigenes]